MEERWSHACRHAGEQRTGRVWFQNESHGCCNNTSAYPDQLLRGPRAAVADCRAAEVCAHRARRQRRRRIRQRRAREGGATAMLGAQWLRDAVVAHAVQGELRRLAPAREHRRGGRATPLGRLQVGQAAVELRMAAGVEAGAPGGLVEDAEGLRRPQGQ